MWKSVYVNLILYFLLAVGCLSASAEPLTLPAAGVWNTYNAQVNVIECANVGTAEYRVAISIRANSGSEIAARRFPIAARGTLDVVLTDLVPANSYGIYTIDSANAAPGAIACRTAFYRSASAAAGKPVEYAFVLPVTNPHSGTTAGIYNSMNPEGRSTPVLNWLSIYNPGDRNFNASVDIYKATGRRDRSKSFRVRRLKPGERRDYAIGHADGQLTGIYRIRPTDSNQPYGAFLTRYSQTAGGFNYAFPLVAESGSCDSGPVSASTMDPATNWAEIANPTGDSIAYTVEVSNQSGRQVYRERLVLPKYSQHNIYLNQYLGERNVGRFRVRCADGSSYEDRLLVQSLFYGHPGAGTRAVEWAYAAQALGASGNPGDTVATSINTYMNAYNWGKYFALDDSRSVQMDIQVYSASGTAVAQQASSINVGGSRDIGLHEYVPRNFVGMAFAFPSSPTVSLRNEVLRVYPNSQGRIGYIMNVPSITVARSSYQPPGGDDDDDDDDDGDDDDDSSSSSSSSGQSSSASSSSSWSSSSSVSSASSGSSSSSGPVPGDLLVEGTGIQGALVVVENPHTGAILGTDTVGSDRRWSVRLTNPNGVPCRVWVHSQGRYWIQSVSNAPASCY